MWLCDQYLEQYCWATNKQNVAKWKTTKSGTWDVWNAISVEFNILFSERWEFFFLSFPKNVLLTCIKIQGFPMKINHLQKWLCLCFLYWFHQLRMAVKAKTLSNFFSVAPLLILDFLSLGRETEIIIILKKKRTKKIFEMFQISLTHVLRSTLPSPISFFCNAIRTFYS